MKRKAPAVRKPKARKDARPVAARTTTEDALAVWTANSAASLELRTAAQSGNGAHMIRAYLGYRDAGVPVPAAIQAWLEHALRSVLAAQGAAAVSEALALSTAKGGISGGPRAQAAARRTAFLDRVQFRFDQRKHCLERQRANPSPHADRDAIAAQTDKSIIEAAGAEYGYKSAVRLWHLHRPKR